MAIAVLWLFASILWLLSQGIAFWKLGTILYDYERFRPMVSRAIRLRGRVGKGFGTGAVFCRICSVMSFVFLGMILILFTLTFASSTTFMVS